MTTVLQIIPGLGAGGAEQACIDVAGGLKEKGYHAIVISSGGPRVNEVIRAGAIHITYPVDSKNPVMIFMNALWLMNFIRRNRVNIVHARSRAPAWSAYMAARMTGTPFVTTNHAAYKFSSLLKKFYNSVMVRGDRIIAISEFIGNHIRQNYKVTADNIRVIPRGIDLDQFDPAKITSERRDRLKNIWGVNDGRLILLPSRLSPIKGQKLLIEAMSLLPSQYRDIVAVILGDDQGRAGYKNELEKLIDKSGLQDRIKLVEHCKDMPAAYSMASLVVAPSLVPEGFGRVPVEAMAMGVPVIATDLGGYTETIQPGVTGWLVSPNRPTQLADAIVKALHQPFDTTHARQHVQAKYDKRKMVADTLTVYDELASKK